MTRTARILRLLALACGLVAVGLMAWRLRRGIDVTDEAFYAALPARFAMGDQPYVDELNVAQNVGVLLYPFVKLHDLLRGFSGLFLFLRALYLVFFALVGWSAFALGRVRLPWPAAFLVGLGCITYLPYSLPGLSYNTVGLGLLAIGLFVAARALLVAPRAPAPGEPWRPDPFFWAGLALGGAAYAYPTLLPAAVLEGAVIVVFAERRAASFARFVGGGLAMVVVVSPLFFAAGRANLHELLAYNATSGPPVYTLDNLSLRFDQFVASYPGFYKQAFVLALAAVLARRWPLVVGVALAYVPFWVALPGTHPKSSLWYVTAMGLHGTIFLFALRDVRVARVLGAAVWLPSMMTAAITALSSTNGVVAAGIGMFPGAILSSLLLAVWIDETSKRWTWAWLRPAAELAPFGFVFVMLKMATHEDAVYRDGRLPELTALVTRGPYRGLYTTPARKAWLDRVDADIQRFAPKGGKRALFYFDFPAGYLYAHRAPLVSSAWIFPWLAARGAMEAAYFADHATPGDLVLRVGGAFNPSGAPVDGVVAARCVLVSHGDGYDVFTVR